MTVPDSPPEEVRLIKSRRRATQILIVFAALFVIVPFLFWRGTWFGRSLTEGELGKYLADTENPRHIQHALVQIAERIGRNDAAVERWYPQVLRLASSPVPEVRVMVAWVLGADTHSEEFNQALRSLLQDSDRMVRRNAALSLVRFGDPSGRPELRNMLLPFTVRAPASGPLRYRLEEGNAVDQGTLLARIETALGETEVRSPLPGTLEHKLLAEGASVSEGEEILVLSPRAEHVWEALRAFYLVGQEEDLAEVERFARGAANDMPEKIQQQALLTAQEIRRRASATRERQGMNSSP
ncbi:MAG: HEAT repeat domain-containing protein [Acidobacteria bacterium]|nr:HEAT repeat domain-containing protein [Acidobacteriota bacterium]